MRNVTLFGVALTISDSPAFHIFPFPFVMSFLIFCFNSKLIYLGRDINRELILEDHLNYIVKRKGNTKLITLILNNKLHIFNINIATFRHELYNCYYVAICILN